MRFSSISIGAEFQPQAEILAHLTALAAAVGVEFIVVGALARDLMIRGVTGQPLGRATTDIDVAVAVESWAQLAQLTAELTPVRDSPHKFFILGTEVDIVPFDGVEQPDRTITWSNDQAMTVFGMAEALARAEVFDLGIVTVKVASLPAQIVLKLLAWEDRHLVDTRDALDLRSIIRAYDDPPYSQRVSHRSAEFHDFDLELAGADELGFESIRLLAPADRPRLTELLDRHIVEDSLLPARMSHDIARNRLLLQALRRGMARDADPT